MPNNSCKANHNALRQIEKKIRLNLKRGRLILSLTGSLSPPVKTEDAVEALVCKTYREALRQAKECGDPSAGGEFFKNAGVDSDTTKEILRALFTPTASA